MGRKGSEGNWAGSGLSLEPVADYSKWHWNNCDADTPTAIAGRVLIWVLGPVVWVGWLGLEVWRVGTVSIVSHDYLMPRLNRFF